MRPAILVTLTVLMLALTGAAFAQSDPTATSPTTASPEVQGESPTPPSEPAATSPTAESSAAASGTAESLPATAGNAPYFLGIGLAALGAFAVLFLYRRKPRTARS